MIKRYYLGRTHRYPEPRWDPGLNLKANQPTNQEEGYNHLTMADYSQEEVPSTSSVSSSASSSGHGHGDVVGSSTHMTPAVSAVSHPESDVVNRLVRAELGLFNFRFSLYFQDESPPVLHRIDR